VCMRRAVGQEQAYIVHVLLCSVQVCMLGCILQKTARLRGSAATAAESDVRWLSAAMAAVLAAHAMLSRCMASYAPGLQHCCLLVVNRKLVLLVRACCMASRCIFLAAVCFIIYMARTFGASSGLGQTCIVAHSMRVGE
jgi:hypothetical protein